MTGDSIIRQGTDSDSRQVVAIFNHYVGNGFAAYPETPVREQFFSFLCEGSLSFYVIESPGGVIGFGVIRPFLPFPAFKRTGMLTYFILPGYTNQGLGSRLLSVLTDDAKKRGISMLIANMSSRNEPSIGFHKKQAFYEAGRLNDAGVKFGRPFDLSGCRRRSDYENRFSFLVRTGIGDYVVFPDL